MQMYQPTKTRDLTFRKIPKEEQNHLFAESMTQDGINKPPKIFCRNSQGMLRRPYTCITNLNY